MVGDKLQAIMAQEEQVLRVAVAKAMTAYNNQPTADNMRNWNAAKTALEKFEQRAVNTAGSKGEDRFKNRTEALAWLQQRGQISAGKFSQDCAKGLITVWPDKTISKHQVMTYAEQIFGQVRQTPAAFDFAAKKERLELEKLELDIEKRKLENRKEDVKWLHKDEAWAQLAATIGTLRDALRHQCHVGQATVIHLAGGDPSRGPEVYEGLEEIIARAFNEVIGAGRIEGVFNQEDAT